jgi:histidinol-phosphate phosphatase family protein
MNLHDLPIDKSWTLFLDRDGVINRLRENDYVKNWSEFEFLPGAKESIRGFSDLFGRIVVVTNQQGIGKGIYTVEDLESIHLNMVLEVILSGGRIDRVYFAPQLEKEKSNMRKPNTGMAEKAAEDFPEINFEQSIIIGDSTSDMEFGKRKGMKTILVGEKQINPDDLSLIDYRFQNLEKVWHSIKK